MGRCKPLALARILTLAASVGVPGLAHAADLLPPPPPPLPPPPVDVGGGWYLRGDVGVGILDLRKTVVEDVSTPPIPYNYSAIQDHVGDQVFVGVGVGYQFNPWLRFDLTGEYRTKAEWRFVAEDLSYGTRGGYNLTAGKFSSVVALANGYVDLGNWYGVTPFIGAGVGFAHHMFGAVTDQGLGTYSGGFGRTAAAASPSTCRLSPEAPPPPLDREAVIWHALFASPSPHATGAGDGRTPACTVKPPPAARSRASASSSSPGSAPVPSRRCCWRISARR
jgi:opacity protein-like surface antigen